MADIKRIECGPRMSMGVVHNGIAYLAGQVGKPGDSVTEQTREVLAQVDRLLALAGTDKTRILMLQIYISDMANFPRMNEVYDTWVVQGLTPPRATVEAKLANPAWSTMPTHARCSAVSSPNQGISRSMRARQLLVTSSTAPWR